MCPNCQKAERDLCEAVAILNAVATVLVGDDVSDFEQSFPSVRGVLNLREALAEAREDIKAFATVLHRWADKPREVSEQEARAAHKRIHDRKLLEEVSDGE